jgi:hypothetical protein
MAAPKKKTTKKSTKPAARQTSTAGYPQHIIAMTYFVVILALVFLSVVVIRYVTHLDRFQ